MTKDKEMRTTDDSRKRVQFDVPDDIREELDSWQWGTIKPTFVALSRVLIEKIKEDGVWAVLGKLENGKLKLVDRE